jgi:putative endonuclease
MLRRISAAVAAREQDVSPTALIGRDGEEEAYWHLREKGFIMVERNFRARGSHKEIDLIGWEGDTLVFIEVKTRGAEGLILPETAVGREKERLLIAAAREYRRQAHRLSAPIRFDIVSVLVSPGGTKVEHFRDAFRDSPAPHARP